MFGERKVSELRAWFDSRLEDAIKAAEEEGKISPAQGTDYNPFRFLFASFSISSCKKVFGFFFQCMLSVSVIMCYIGLNNGMKLFYLAADSVSDATSTVVHADSFVRATGSEKHQEERKKTGIFKDTRLFNRTWIDNLDQLQKTCSKRLRKCRKN